MDLKERFLKYVSYDTQSSEESTTFPSTEKQKVLLAALRDEMEALGMTEVSMDQYGYVMGTVPATPGCENAPVIGFIAHADTSPDMSGKDVKPRVIEEYDGCDIALNGQLTMRVADFPELEFFKGHTLIHTDGTTLLGADDKAGVAEIMALCKRLTAPDAPEHCTVCIGFTPDEEIGSGADHFDVAGFGADYAYTVDGGALGELEYENFNAASCAIKVHGVNIHPGSAKNQKRNALLMAIEWNSMLPPAETPAHTCGYEGFYHLMHMEGDEELATLQYIIRDHDAQKFDARKATVQQITDYLNQKWGAGTFECVIRDSYRNMREIMEQHMDVVEKAKAAFEANGVTPVISPIRGGTDGARLSYMGLPCPNLSTGGYNFHGRKEMITVEAMEAMVNVLESIVRNA